MDRKLRMGFTMAAVLAVGPTRAPGQEQHSAHSDDANLVQVVRNATRSFQDVWAWRDNPAGTFADWNPRVACSGDEGN